MSLPLGKIPVDLLESVVFRNLGVKRDEVILGPAAGLDGAVIDIGGKSLIVSMDPITGALTRIGWLAVNINANDVATFGVRPTLFFSTILLPEDSTGKNVEAICVQIDKATRILGMAVAGGHCEVTPELTGPIVAGCAMGVTEEQDYVTAGGAKLGDTLILTKSAGIEGTAILAMDREALLKNALSTSVLENAKEYGNHISIVDDAINAYETGGVNAMHDPTEGGVAGGIHEIADASNLGVKIFEERIPVRRETERICEFYGIDPLQLMGSGTLLISSKPQFARTIVKRLTENRIQASIVGEFLEDPHERLIEGRDGSVKSLTRPISDHLWFALSNCTPPKPV